MVTKKTAKKETKAKKATSKDDMCSTMCDTKSSCCSKSSCGCGSCIYWLGFIGAIVYYLAAASSFWGAILGILKAFVWPIFVVHAILSFVGA